VGILQHWDMNSNRGHMNHLDMQMESKDHIKVWGSNLDHSHTHHCDSRFEKDRKRYMWNRCNLMEPVQLHRNARRSLHICHFHKESKQ
jgi:hypothetical protein